MVRRSSGDIFSYSEFAVAGGLTKRAFQHLADANAKSPRSDWLPPGGGIRTLKRTTVIGGFMAAGLPLFGAARVASALTFAEFNTNDGEMPSGLDFLVRRLPRSAINEIPGGGTDTDYWYHRALIAHPEVYTPGNALNSDVLIEVVDRRHVYVGGGLKVLNLWDKELEAASYAGRIEGLERDSEVEFVSTSEMAPFDSEHPDFATKGTALNAVARAAYRNAVGRMIVNASLAIRNGFDRVARSRGELADEVVSPKSPASAGGGPS